MKKPEEIFREYENKLLQDAIMAHESKRHIAIKKLTKTIDKRNEIIKRKHPELKENLSEDEKKFLNSEVEEIKKIAIGMEIPLSSLTRLLQLKARKEYETT